jgi:glucosamine--fructose-6-phosphate aminotransferase (isomerizing)
LNPSGIENNIRAQADSLACVLQQQYGAGAPSVLQAASLIRTRSKILITGMGASLFASWQLKYFLSSRCIDASVVEAGELLHYLNESYRDAVVVIISRSGESVEIAKLLAVLGTDSTVIGITNEPASLLARKANVCLLVGSLADQIVAIQTYTGTLLALHILGSAVDGTLEKTRKEIDTLIPELSRLTSVSLDNLQSWDEFFESRSPLHLLARGPSLSSALGGALLFNEIAKHPALGMPAASFRHGPVELVDRNFRGLIFAPQGRTRDLNLALARDLASFGGQVKVIGPSSQCDLGIDLCEVPATQELLAPIFEIVPIQAAAVRMAQLHGIVPGSFRFAPQVAINESSF